VSSARTEHLGELKELRLTLQNHKTDSGFASEDQPVSAQVDAMLGAEQRYSELEKVLASVEAERDQLIEEKASKNKMIHTLVKENKSLSSALKKQQNFNSGLSSKLEEAKSEIATLQSSFTYRGSRGSSRNNEDGGPELMQVMRC